MKKIIATALSLIMVLSFAGCGETKKAEEAVTNLFEAFKAGDFEKAEEFLYKEGDLEEAESDDMFNHVFTKIDYKILSSEKIDGETVNVTASVTAPDMKVAVGEFFDNALQFALSNAFSENPISDEELSEEMEKMFVEATDKEDLGTVTNEVVIKVVKTPEGWKVESDDEFADVITGRMMTAFKELEEAMSPDAE